MSLIRKHGAVLQAWACLDLVRFLSTAVTFLSSFFNVLLYSYVKIAQNRVLSTVGTPGKPGGRFSSVWFTHKLKSLFCKTKHHKIKKTVNLEYGLHTTYFQTM